MLSDLTRYLLLYKRLCIPHVGTFEIVQQAPEYTVVDKLIYPPQYSVRHLPKEQLSDHQLEFIALSSQTNKESARHDLISFGNRIKTLAEKKSFIWNGIGALRFHGANFSFVNQFSSVEGLNTVNAHKVLRENVEHSRLVGDRQTSSLISSSKVRNRRWSLSLKLGWIILAVAVLAIIFVLFKDHFNPSGAGLKLKFF